MGLLKYIEVIASVSFPIKHSCIYNIYSHHKLSCLHPPFITCIAHTPQRERLLSADVEGERGHLFIAEFVFSNNAGNSRCKR